MKFIVTSTHLLKALQRISGAIASSSVLAVLEDFLFELRGNTLTITSTDLETMMRVNIIVAEGQGDGLVCIPAKILTEHLKNLPEQPVTFAVDKDNAVVMSTSTGKYKIAGDASDDYPKAPAADDATSFTIPAASLIDCISKTLFAVSTDTLRPAMTGVYFALTPDGLTCVSTDAHRLSRFTLSSVAPPQTDGFVVPRRPLQMLKATVPADETPLELSYNASHLFIQAGQLSLSCRLIDARFPDYAAIIPSASSNVLTVNRADFAVALRRVNAFANRTTNQILLGLTGNALTLSAHDIDFGFEGKETMPCEYAGDDMQIAFNARLLVEMVANAEGADLLLEMGAPTRAALLRPVEKIDGEDHLMLLMPLMVGA